MRKVIDVKIINKEVGGGGGRAGGGGDNKGKTGRMSRRLVKTACPFSEAL